MKLVLNCVIYLSEARNHEIIQQCRHLCQVERLPLIHWFEDSIYNRSSFYFATEILSNTLRSNDVQIFIQKVLSFCRFGYNSVNFQKHSGQHPTLGTIDHISFSPLTAFQSLENSSNDVEIIKSNVFSVSSIIAAEFTHQYFNQFRVPVYTYGHLSDPIFMPTSKGPFPLKTIRKSLGYFRPLSQFSPEVLLQRLRENPVHISPTLGTVNDYSPSKGITCIGCVPLVQNYNIRIQPNDHFISHGGSNKEAMFMAKQIAASLRSSHVESLALPYHESLPSSSPPSLSSYIEIACNLLDPAIISDETVYSQLIQILQNYHYPFDIVTAYSTNPSMSQLLHQYQSLHHHSSPSSIDSL